MGEQQKPATDEDEDEDDVVIGSCYRCNCDVLEFEAFAFRGELLCDACAFYVNASLRPIRRKEQRDG